MYILEEPPFRFTLAHEVLGTVEITAPGGWDDAQHTILRDPTYHGVAVKYTLDFNFVREGREFLQTVYHTYGVQGVALLTVYELNPNAVPPEERYFASYTGRINLSAYVATETDASSNAEETGFTRALLNLDDVEVNLMSLESYSGNAMQRFAQEGTPITLHSKAVVKRYEAKVSNNAPAYNYRPVDEYKLRFGTLYLGFDDVKTNEFNAYSYPTGLSFPYRPLFGPLPPLQPNELIEFNEVGRITVELNLAFVVECFQRSGDFDEARIDFFVGLNEQSNHQRVYTWDSRVAYGGGDVNGQLYQSVSQFVDLNFNVVEKDKLYVYGLVAVDDVSQYYEFEWQITPMPAMYIKVFGSTTTAPSAATGFMLHEVWARVVANLVGRGGSFYSELLGRTDSAPTQYAQDGELSNVMLINGSAIRGFPVAERPPFVALKDLYKSTDALRPIGMGVEVTDDGVERVRVEGFEFFYKSDVVLKLGMVEGLKLSAAQDYYRTQVEVGFDKWESGSDNSLDEVNTKQIRTTAIDTIPGKYTALSKYAASGYLIESVRRLQFEETPAKEDSNDKTNFWVCVARKPGGGFETERTQNILSTLNILSPDTSYNLRISPMRNLLRHGQLIRAGLYRVENRPVKFSQGNANFVAETRFLGEAAPVLENGYLRGQDLAAPLWIPEYYDFTAPLPAFQRKLIEANPYGLISFVDSFGNVKKGYLKSVKVRLTDGEADFRLLRYNG